MKFSASFQRQGLHDLSFLLQLIYINVIVQPVLLVNVLCSESIEDSKWTIKFKIVPYDKPLQGIFDTECTHDINQAFFVSANSIVGKNLLLEFLT